MATEFHTGNRRFYRTIIGVVLLVVCSVQLVAAPGMHSAKSVSRPEKVWSVFHPFKAKKVLTCARRSQFVTDSLEKAGTLTDKNGGQLDAFRHAYWMALMINEGFRESVVRRIGERHEKGNYLDFKKGKLEDSQRADSLMSVMDLRNNETGIELGKTFVKGDKSTSLIQLITIHIWNGKLVIMLKNAGGEYLDCSGGRINAANYTGKWYIPKCIVDSDHVIVEH